MKTTGFSCVYGYVCLVFLTAITLRAAPSETVEYIGAGVPDPVIIVGAGATGSERFAAGVHFGLLARARTKGMAFPLRSSPSHQPYKTRGEGRCDGEERKGKGGTPNG